VVKRPVIKQRAKRMRGLMLQFPFKNTQSIDVSSYCLFIPMTRKTVKKPGRPDSED
jgi:hypothetical protein